MKLKHIAIATLALVAGTSSFAANITRNALGAGNTGTGLVLFVTDLTKGTSYDLDLGITTASFNSKVASATFNQTWTLNDTNWGSFFNNTDSYSYAVVGGLNNGLPKTAGNNTVLTTVNAAQDLSALPTTSASQIQVLTAGIDKVVGDINTQAAATSNSFIADSAKNDVSYFGDRAGGYLLNTLNNDVLPNFQSATAFGQSAAFLSLGNTGGARSAGNYTVQTFASSFTLATNAAGLTTLQYGAVTPSVPEPGTYGLALVGLVLIGAIARRRA